MCKASKTENYTGPYGSHAKKEKSTQSGTNEEKF